jgi:hypothetical protein
MDSSLLTPVWKSEREKKSEEPKKLKSEKAKKRKSERGSFFSVSLLLCFTSSLFRFFSVSLVYRIVQ